MKEKEISFLKTKEAGRINIGSKIRNIRESLGISQEKLSNMTGLDRANISKIENGRYNVSIDLLLRIVGAMGYEIILIPSSEKSEYPLR